MSRAPARRLTVRDFKNPRGRAFAGGRWREFGVGLGTGLGLGLLVAVAVFVTDRRKLEETANGVQPAPQQQARRPGAETGVTDATDNEDGPPQYDFYEMLPKFEVVVPEKDREVRRELPSVPISTTGVYVLQAGSYRNRADADRIRVQLERLGIDAKVERVAVDADVWHRVRIGPMRDLAQINRLRDLLRKQELNPLAIRVGD